MRAFLLPVIRLGFLWMGLAALALAAGSVAHADLYQRYQAWRFDRVAVAAGVNEPAADEHTVALSEGDVIGRLEVPRIGMSLIVLHGVEDATLRVGVGHVPGTPLPGGDGNVALAAHRDTFFRSLERIRHGDRIVITSFGRTDAYVVESTEVVDPEDTSVLESRGRTELTLVTCYPFTFVGAAPSRFVVHARPG